MGYLRTLAALGLATAASAANAGVSSTWTLASDYDFRGVTQSAQDPALQGSLDYAHDSGWYIGAWGSNIDFGDDVDADIEVDVYTGFSGGPEGGVGWDAGIVYYSYPGDSDLNYLEAYAGLAYSWFEGKVSYSNDYGGDSTEGNAPAWYVEANGTFPLPNDFSVLAHVGYSFGDYWDDLDDADEGRPYLDYAVGFGYTAGNFELELKWVDASDLKESRNAPQDVFGSDGRVLFTFATTFPWGQ